MSVKETNAEKGGMINKFLNIVERAGNALPHPATLFAILSATILVLSFIMSLFDPQVIHPGTGETINVVNLLSKEGLDLILTRTVTNFTGFAPLGTVLVALLGIGIAESSGLIGTMLRLVVLKSPAKILTFVVVFAGVISNTASEVGYVLLVPLAAVIFLAAGRHPLAGLAAAFAGVSGGYSANLLLGTVDPLLAGLSQEAAQIMNPAYTVSAASNYYFMFVSTFLISGLGTLVTEKIVIPKLGLYTGDAKAEDIHPLNAAEKKGLFYATIATLVMVLVMVWGLMSEDSFLAYSGFLREAGTGSILKSPFLKGIVTIIFVVAAVAGIAYGVGAKTIKSDADVMKGMGKSMETLGSYIVLVFFAAQFVEYFKWTNIGLISAISGAEFLQSINLTGIPLMIGFILIAALINIIMGSASAKWAIMAPVFIPMFMILGYSPEFTQLVYRIGDSVTNIISPMLSYFALIVAFINQYDKKAGIGTVISIMLPYSIVFFIGWSIMLAIWMILGLPIGPGAPLHYGG